MFDIGGWEFLLIVIVAVVVVGPKELPGAIRTMMSFVRRARELAREFQSGLEDVAREVELDKLGNEMKGMVDPGGAMSDFRNDIEGAIDGDNQIRNAMDFDPQWTDDDLADFPSAAELAEREAAKAAKAAGENRIAPPEAAEGTPVAAPADRPADTSPGADAGSAGEKAAEAPPKAPDTNSGKPA